MLVQKQQELINKAKELARNALKNREFVYMEVTKLGEYIHVFDLPRFIKIEKVNLDYQKFQKDHGVISGTLTAITQSIRDFGVLHPIIVSKDGVIIDGMSRVIALMYAPPGTKAPVEILDISCKSSEQHVLACILLAYFTTLNKNRTLIPSLDEVANMFFREYTVVPMSKPRPPKRGEIFTFSQMVELISENLGIQREELEMQFNQLLTKFMQERARDKKRTRIEHSLILTLASIMILIKQCRDTRIMRSKVYRITGKRVRSDMMIKAMQLLGVNRIEPNCRAMAEQILRVSKVNTQIDMQKFEQIRDPYELATALRCAGVSPNILRDWLGTSGRRECP